MRGGTYRRGRTVISVSSKKSNDQVYLCVATFFTIIFLIGIPILNLMNENTLKDSKLLSKEVEDNIVDVSQAEKVDEIVHLQGATYDSTVADPHFGVYLNHGIHLKRETEYCQWHEIAVTRKLDNNCDSKEKDCEMITTYNYIKNWFSYRTNSLFFDQPAAHHNPQRDPFPSQTFVTNDLLAKSENNQNSPYCHIDSNVLSNIKKSFFHSIDFTINAQPYHSKWNSFFQSIFGDWSFSWLNSNQEIRYEDINVLQGSQYSKASQENGFVYVGQGGYFFSPYQSDMLTKLTKAFFGYMEGSIFDWQFGDLMPSCTAGDIRIKYYVKDPDVISVIGIVNSKSQFQTTSLSEHQENPILNIGNYLSSSPNINKIGITFEGSQTSKYMMEEIILENWWKVLITRLLLFPWSFLISKLLGAYFGIELRYGYGLPKPTSFTISILSILGTWAFIVGFCEFYINKHHKELLNDDMFSSSSSSPGLNNKRENYIFGFNKRTLLLFTSSIISMILVHQRVAKTSTYSNHGDGSGFSESWNMFKQIIRIKTIDDTKK